MDGMLWLACSLWRSGRQNVRRSPPGGATSCRLRQQKYRHGFFGRSRTSENAHGATHSLDLVKLIDFYAVTVGHVAQTP